MFIACASDLDGLGILAGIKTYSIYHQKLFHNLFFILFISFVFCLLTRNKIRNLVIFIVIGHLHLLFDYIGSGSGWGYNYLFPFGEFKISSLGWWQLVSWQNLLFDILFIISSIYIMFKEKIFVFEYFAPKLDCKIIRWCTNYQKIKIYKEGRKK